MIATSKQGENNSQAKLPEHHVRAIRMLYKAAILTPSELANLFKVSRETVHKIVSRETWRHVK